jgi:hypothetical protein
MSIPQLLGDAATVALTLFTSAVTTCVLVSVFAPTSERRKDARASLRILLRPHAPPTDLRAPCCGDEISPAKDAAGE